jgi:hypothetical protein
MAYSYNPYQNYTQQIQNGGVIHATEAEARKYPVAPGYSMIFIDDEKSKLYTKTAGFSQLEQPVFKKYNISEEIEPQSDSKAEGDIDIPPTPEYALKSDFDKLRADFKKLKAKVEKDND